MVAHKSDAPVTASSLEALRLFPLPDSVLFPGTVLPLHVFEPRYRAMIADALAGDRVIALAMLKPGHEEHSAGSPPIHDVVGVGQIVHVERVADGRYYIALQGMCRARLVAEHRSDEPFRSARAVMMPDLLPAGGMDALHPQLLVLKSCLVKLMAHTPDRAEALAEVLEHLTEPGMLADILCALAVENTEARQEALATDSVAERLAMATEAIAGLLLKAEAGESASTLPM